MPVKISQLLSYPIKSCAAIEHEKAAIDAMGIKGDRQMMIVQENGLFLSQRTHPKLSLIQPEVISPNQLKLSAPDMSDIVVEHEGGHQVQQVTVWKDTFDAAILHPQLNDWLSEYLAINVKLVKYSSVSHRLIDPDFANNRETVAFADGYPILVTHEATLACINEQLSNPINMSRFRPNIVVTSDQAAWQELNWKQLNSDDLMIDLVKPCARCVMTGINQKTGTQTGTEVFKTLKNTFAHDDKAVFGVNAIPYPHKKGQSFLTVGMELDVIQKQGIE